MNYFVKIKEILFNWYLSIFYWNVEFAFLNLYKNTELLNYIEKKAIELSEEENVKVFSVPFDEMNKYETDENNKAVGLFRYKKKENMVEYEKILKSRNKLNITKPLERSEIYPRIEISEKGNVFTTIHELGHYFIYKRDEIQSEEKANIFIKEFFDNYLPPFFTWIFQIDINIRTNNKLKFTTLECYRHYQEYKKFKKC